MNLAIGDFKTKKSYAELVPPLSQGEYSQLRLSIKNEGLHIPILVNSENIILDGHHRFKICKELGINPEIKIKNFTNSLDEQIFVITVNLRRRQLSDPQRFELGEKLEPLIAEKNKEFQKEEGAKYGRGIKKTLLSNESKDNRNERTTTAQVAKDIGLSRTKYEKLRTIKTKSPEIYEKVKSGDKSVAYAYKQVQRQEKKKDAKPIPQGQFNVILADPPWKYDINTRGSPDDHYDVMDDIDISKMKIPSAKDCVLFLWGTAPKLVEALQVIEEWGFTYKTNMVWVKDKIGTGYYFRGKHELLLVAVKGNPLIPEEADRPESVLVAPRTKHSKKPEQIYSIIERMYPDSQYLELFARNSRKGWESWGNEVA